MGGSSTSSSNGGSSSGASSSGGSGASSSGASSSGGSGASSSGTTAAGDGGGNDGGASSQEGGSTLPPLPTGPIDRKLSIPERQEWDTADGYCGEESIQTIALHYGTWISQALVRTIGGRPVKIGDGSEGVLTTLHFHFDTWDYASANNPEYQDFMVWMKGYLVRGIPTIFAEYVGDASPPLDPDYDHLVPGIGIKTSSAGSTTFDPQDTLYFNTNEMTSVAKSFVSLSGTRSCTVASYDGGCVPTQTDYGVAVTGIIDDGNVTLPVEVSVPVDHEPDTTSGQKPIQLTATALVSNLVAGKSYTLLRYDDYTKVPTSGDAASYLSSPADVKTPFTATGTTWTYKDPMSFSSASAVYYRCVPN
jgi:hypothetical protein